VAMAAATAINAKTKRRRRNTAEIIGAFYASARLFARLRVDHS
jgi:hypothetical protein